MTLKVIGAGFGRTGTESMKRALEMLGVGPCHHMYEVLSDKRRYDAWFRVLTGQDAPDWTSLLDGYASSVDWPVALYWRELAALFPDARILLTLRPSEDWFASMEATVLALMRDRNNHPMAAALADRVFPDGVSDRSQIVAAYERNIAEVLRDVSPQRLIVHRLGEGWAPLCVGLGVEAPAQPYPISNAAGDFHDRDADLAARRG